MIHNQNRVGIEDDMRMDFVVPKKSDVFKSEGGGTPGSDAGSSNESNTSFAANKNKEENKIYHLMRMLVNLKTLFSLIFFAIIIAAVAPNFIINRVYQSRLINSNIQDILELSSQKFIKAFSEDHLTHLTKLVNTIDMIISERLIDSHVAITNFSANHMDFHKIFLPFILHDDWFSSIGFTFDSGGIVVVRRGPEGSVEKVFTEWINGTRYIAIYRMGGAGYSEKEEVVAQKYSDEYCTCNLAWFLRPPTTEIEWNLFVSKPGKEILYPYKSVFDNSGIFLGKISVIFYLTDISHHINGLNDVTFMFNDEGDLFASSTFNVDANREKKIYKAHEYVNEVVRESSLYLLEEYGNYTSIQVTDHLHPNFLTVPSNGEGYFLWVESFEVESLKVFVATLISKDSKFAEMKNNEIKVIVVTLIVTILAICFAVSMGILLSIPISQTSRVLVKMSKLELVPIPNICLVLYEFAKMRKSLQILKNGLINFNKFLPSSVLRRMLQRNEEIGLDLRDRRCSICFVDIAKFTEMTEKSCPESIVDLFVEFASSDALRLTDFFIMTDTAVSSNGGIIDKYVGDACMCLFKGEDHEMRCIRSVYELFSLLIDRQQKVFKNLAQPFDIRIGADSGKVLLGFIGTTNRMSYTCVGDVVNIAARLEPLNKYFETRVLVANPIYEATKKEFLYKWVGDIVLRGKEKETTVWCLVGKRSSVSKKTVTRVKRHNCVREKIARNNIVVAKEHLVKIGKEGNRTLDKVSQRLIESLDEVLSGKKKKVGKKFSVICMEMDQPHDKVTKDDENESEKELAINF